MEFDPDALYSMMKLAVRQMVDGGYKQIIAHFERYSCLYGRRERLDELRECGAMLQLNFDRLLGRDGLLRRNPWRRLMKEGYVDYLGSDTHGMHFRPLHVKSAVEWLTAEVDAGIVRHVMVDNIHALLGEQSASRRESKA